MNFEADKSSIEALYTTVKLILKSFKSSGKRLNFFNCTFVSHCEGKDVTFLTGRQPREFQVSFGCAKIFLTRFRNDSYHRVCNFCQFIQSLLKRCVETLHRRLKTL